MTNRGNGNTTVPNTPVKMRRNVNQNSSPSEFEKDKVKSKDNKVLKQTRWVQIRLIPIWLRIIIVLLLMLGAIIAGLKIGYGVIGDGDSSKVLERSTWQHIIDIINGKE